VSISYLQKQEKGERFFIFQTFSNLRRTFPMTPRIHCQKKPKQKSPKRGIF